MNPGYRTCSSIVCLVAAVWPCLAADPELAEPGAIPVPPPRVDREALRLVPPYPASPDDLDRMAVKALEPFPDEDPAQVLSFIREELGSYWRDAMELGMRDRRRTEVYVAAVVADALALMAIKAEDPSRFAAIMRSRELEREAETLAGTTGNAEGPQRVKRLAELRAVLDEAFDVKQGLMKTDVDTMADELERLRTLLVERERNRTAIVEHRMRELTGQAEGLVW